MSALDDKILAYEEARRQVLHTMDEDISFIRKGTRALYDAYIYFAMVYDKEEQAGLLDALGEWEPSYGVPANRHDPSFRNWIRGMIPVINQLFVELSEEEQNDES